MRGAYVAGQRLAQSGTAAPANAFNHKAVRDRPRLPISAIIRCRDAQFTLGAAVESIVHHVSEVWIIDNDSSDQSREIAGALRSRYPDVVRLDQYHATLAEIGSGYGAATRARPGDSIARFYNYCFGLGTQPYLLKWDADMVALPNLYPQLARVVSRAYDTFRFDGLDPTGVYSSCYHELMFRRDLEWKFVDRELYEALEIANSRRTYTAWAPLYLHLKQFV